MFISDFFNEIKCDGITSFTDFMSCNRPWIMMYNISNSTRPAKREIKKPSHAISSLGNC